MLLTTAASSNRTSMYPKRQKEPARVSCSGVAAVLWRGRIEWLITAAGRTIVNDGEVEEVDKERAVSRSGKYSCWKEEEKTKQEQPEGQMDDEIR